MTNELAKQPEPNNVVQIGTDSGQVLEMINRAASDPSVDIDKLERLMGLYQQLEAIRAEKSFNLALQAVQSQMPHIKRDADNKHTHSTYARLETVNAALIPVYTSNGFSLSFGTGKSDQPEHILVTCRVSHVGGHTRDYEYPSPITTAGIEGKAMMTRTHASGSALSYGRRYLTLLIFNATMTDEDDDGNTASEKVEQVKIGPKRKRKIIDGMLAAVASEDGPGLLEIADELETEEQLLIWSELRSWERSAIKALITKARTESAQTADPNYVAPATDPEFTKQYDQATIES